MSARSEQTIYERRWDILAVLCLSLFMVILGNTVLNVALPTLVRELHATSTQLQWMVDSYSLVFAGFLLTGGALGDRYGRKELLTVGLVVFGLGSGLSTVATRPEHLIATRAVMGLGGALVMPATLSILAMVFPPAERARAIGIWAGVAGSAAAVGPIAAGLLLNHFWWGSIFFLNIPIVVIALTAGHLLVPTSRDPAHAPLDPPGAALSVGALGSLLYAIIEAPRRGWTDGPILLGFLLAAVLFACFIARELRTENPMLDLRFFKRRGFTAGSVAVTTVFFVMFGTFFMLTQYLQLVKGYSPLGAGVRTLPLAVMLMLMAPTSARIVERVGSARVVATGLSVIAVGMLLMSRAGVDTSYLYLAIAMGVLATGMAMAMAPSTAAIMVSLPMGKAGVGSAVNDTTRELGGSLGVAVLGSLLAGHYASSLSSSASTLPKPVADAATKSLGTALQVAHGLGGTAGAALAQAAKSAYVNAMHVGTLVGAGVALVGAVIQARIMPATAFRPEDMAPPGEDGAAADPKLSAAG